MSDVRLAKLKLMMATLKGQEFAFFWNRCRQINLDHFGRLKIKNFCFVTFFCSQHFSFFALEPFSFSKFAERDFKNRRHSYFYSWTESYKKIFGVNLRFTTKRTEKRMDSLFNIFPKLCSLSHFINNIKCNQNIILKRLIKY